MWVNVQLYLSMYESSQNVYIRIMDLESSDPAAKEGGRNLQKLGRIFRELHIRREKGLFRATIVLDVHLGI